MGLPQPIWRAYSRCVEKINRSPASTPPAPGPTPGHRAQAAALGIVGLPLLTAVLVPLRDDVELASVALIYLVAVVAIALRGGIAIALAAAVGAAFLLNFFFTEPLHTLHVDESNVLISVIVFAALAGLVSVLVGRLGRRSSEAEAARREAQALAFAVGAGDEGLPELVEAIRAGFGLRAIQLSERVGGGRMEVASTGEARDPRWRPDDFVEIDAGRTRLSISGRQLSPDDRRVLAVLTRQFASSLERRRLRGEAAEAELLAESDRFRTALLRAVSHDLRTPLASIKASVSGLLQRDVKLTAESSDELLRSIDTSADRLDRLIGNLLDMSRLEAGVLRPNLQPIGLDEVVPAALSGLDAPAGRLQTELPDDLPRVLADPGLLERALANIVANALRATDAGAEPVRLEASKVAASVALRVVDRGPGIRLAEREGVFAPFQRFDDSPGSRGLGLGLAIARGFVEAMGGRLELKDTPGGGATLVILLPAEQGAAAPREAQPVRS